MIIFLSLHFTSFPLNRCYTILLVLEENVSFNIQLTVTSNHFSPGFIRKPIKQSNSAQCVYFKGLPDMPKGFNIPCSLQCARYADQQQKGLSPQKESNFDRYCLVTFVQEESDCQLTTRKRKENGEIEVSDA